MLLRPSNTLLLDEPTNHLDLDSKDVLLEALEDFGGTLIFVSHDRYFVDRLATKILEIGDGQALLYPGTYEEFVWSRKVRDAGRNGDSAPPASRPRQASPAAAAPPPQIPYEQRKRQEAESRKEQKAAETRRKRIEDLETRIAEREEAIKGLEASMAAPGFYEDHQTAKPIIERHQNLMWEVGNLMSQWEELQGTEA